MELDLIIGIIGAILSSISFLPQVVQIWKTKSADDLSMATIVLLASNGTSWLMYGILKDAMPFNNQCNCTDYAAFNYLFENKIQRKSSELAYKN